MTKQERTARIRELSDLLWKVEGEEYDKLYAEYCELNAQERREYREANEAKIREFFEKNIKGRAWNEIEPDVLDAYSDWHKDVFGFRPRQTMYCGD